MTLGKEAEVVEERDDNNESRRINEVLNRTMDDTAWKWDIRDSVLPQV